MWPDQDLKPQAGSISKPADVTSLDEPWKSAAFKVLLAVALLDPLIIFIILIGIGAPMWVIPLVAGLGLIVPAMVMWLIVSLGWNLSARRYSAQAVLPGAVSKSWQSFGFGPLKRFNNCMTIIADEKHLHIVPMALFRIFGARTASLPLDRMCNLKPMLGGGMIKATLDGRRICGPAWCMNLAMPPDDPTPTQRTQATDP